MKFKYMLFAFVFMLFLILSLGAVAGQDNKTFESDIQADLIKTNNDDSLILENENQQTLTRNHSVSGNGFSDIQNEINGADSGDVIFLNANTYSSSGNPITINKDNLTIIGGSSMDDKSYATLDAGVLSRILNIPSNNIVLKNINFINGNDASQDGGAILWEGNNGDISNCNFTGNTAEFGGAISWKGSDGTITDCSFTGNIALEDGGAIYLTGNNNTISLCSFTGNIAISAGGAINCYRCDFTVISRSVFNRNQADDAGAIYMDGTVNGSKIYDSNFSDNSANSTNGGAIYTIGNNGLIYGCNFNNNNVTLYGGAISYEGNDGKIMDCLFNSNNGTYGGAIFWSGNNGVIDNCTFKANKGEYEGAIRWDGYYGFISRCDFADNTADCGGAIYLGGYDVSILKSNFTNNSATGDAGAIYVYNEKCFVYDCIFTANSADSAGAIYWYTDDNSILNCSFISNTASDSGGAIYSWSNIGGKIEGCNFISNSANSGGALYWLSEDGLIFESNFKSNKALEGGAIYFNQLSDNNDVTMCNFTDNEANSAGAIYCKGNCDIIFSTFKGNKAVNYRHIFNEGAVNLRDSTLESILTISQISDCLFYTSATVNITFDDGTNIDIYKITLYNNNTELKTFSYNPQYKYSYTWDSLAAGTYSITVGANGVNTYDADYNAMVFRVFRHSSSVVINPVANVIYNGNISVFFTVENKTSLSFELKDRKGNIIRNGTVEDNNLTISDLMPGEYVIIITNNESADYEKSSASANFTVFKIKTSISSSDVVGVYNGGKYIIAILKDVYGSAIAKATVGITINGKTKSYVSDANGQVKFTTNSIAPGKYIVKITFNGNEIYDFSSKSVNLKVKKANPKLAAKSKKFKKSLKTKKYQITLKTNLKKPLKKVGVILKIKNKKYKATTNAKGKAIFKIKKLTRKGKYKASVRFNGNKYYNKAVKKVNIIVK